MFHQQEIATRKKVYIVGNTILSIHSYTDLNTFLCTLIIFRTNLLFDLGPNFTKCSIQNVNFEIWRKLRTIRIK